MSTVKTETKTMSSATLPAVRNGSVPAIQSQTEIDAGVLEMVVAQGDLAKLSPAQKTTWYRLRCEAAGLDPRTQPFEYVSLSGKLKLYATKTATDQLIANRKISVKPVQRTFDEHTGIYEVLCGATFPDGQYVEDIGVVHIGALRGEALANGIMKAMTKAKRRTVLSACGLGMLDETEVETIPGAVRYGPNPPSEEDRRREVNETFKAAPKADTRHVGEVIEAGLRSIDTGELLNVFQVERHLLNFAAELAGVEVSRGMKPAEVRHRLAELYEAASETARKRVRKEIARYLTEKHAEALDAAPAPQEPAEGPDPDGEYPAESFAREPGED